METKELLAHLNAVEVAGKTLPAYVTKWDSDCQWLNGEEVCIRRRWGIVQGCRYLLVLFGAVAETVEMCFEERADANAVAKLAKGWGVDRVHVNFINSRFDRRDGRPSYDSLSYCDEYDFRRGEEWHGKFRP